MKSKSKSTIKTLAITSLFTGVLWCWSSRAADLTEAKTLWDHDCAACHGKDGKGETLMGRKLGIKDYTDPKVQKALTDADATKAIKDGVKKNGRQEMRAFGSKFNDEQVKDLVQYIRSFKAK